MPSSGVQTCALDRKSTRLNSSHGSISYAVFCLKTNHTIGPFAETLGSFLSLMEKWLAVGPATFRLALGSFGMQPVSYCFFLNNRPPPYFPFLPLQPAFPS